jgi:hypothetical protein
MAKKSTDQRSEPRAMLMQETNFWVSSTSINRLTYQPLQLKVLKGKLVTIVTAKGVQIFFPSKLSLLKIPEMVGLVLMSTLQQ